MFSYVTLRKNNNSSLWIVINVFYSHQAWKRRWFVLRSGRLSGEPDVLQYYKNQQSRRPIRTINLNLCEQVNTSKHWRHVGGLLRSYLMFSHHYNVCKMFHFSFLLHAFMVILLYWKVDFVEGGLWFLGFNANWVLKLSQYYALNRNKIDFFSRPDSHMSHFPQGGKLKCHRVVFLVYSHIAKSSQISR